MSLLSNPLATPEQLYSRATLHDLPSELQECILYQTSKLTLAAGVLLRLPLDITANAVVLLQRYYHVDPMMKFEFSDVSAATVFLTAKMSAHPRSMRSITNVYTYLLSSSSVLQQNAVQDKFPRNPPPSSSPESYYQSESAYATFRTRLLNIEGQVLNALNFNTHVALPHSRAITYMQTLDLFNAKVYPAETGNRLSALVVKWLNTALLSPQCLYLTAQPNALAVAAIYLAARQGSVKMPEEEWWKVFDVEREELGFLVLGFGSLEGWVREYGMRKMGDGPLLTRGEVRRETVLLKGGVVDEEEEMGRLLDEKAAG